MQTNKVSVLISILPDRHTECTRLCFESLENQTLAADEIIFVIDGNSNQDLEQILDEWQSRLNLKIIRLNQNTGTGHALNVGLEQCQNEFIARVDVDDINRSDRLEIQAEYLSRQPQVGVLGSWITEFEDNENNIKSSRNTPLSHQAIINYSRYRNPMNHMTVMFRKSIITQFGGYENLVGFQDYYLWLKLLKNNVQMANIDDYLVNAGISALGSKRGGIRYIKNEMNFVRLCAKNDYLTSVQALRLFFSRLLFRLIPPSLRQRAYRSLLRTKVDQ